ncbi:MAG: hypothetical protein AAGF99_17450 [Bacteroidota bacterium]
MRAGLPLLLIALLWGAVIPGVAAQERPGFPPVTLPPIPADTVLAPADRAAAVALISTRLNLGEANEAMPRAYLSIFDEATEKWPPDERAAARARIDAVLTSAQANALVARCFARQSDATLARTAAWLRAPLVEAMLTAQVEFDPDALAAFRRRVKADGYTPRLAERLPLVEALIEEIGYHEFAVSSFHRDVMLYRTLTNVHGTPWPQEAAELFVATEGAARARATVEGSILSHQYHYRRHPTSDIAHYIEALQSEAGQGLLALRAALDAERDAGFNALVLEQAGVAAGVWAPEVASARPDALRRDRVRALLAATRLATLVGTFSYHVQAGALGAAGAEGTLSARERRLFAEVFAEAFDPARNIDQLAHLLATTVADSVLTTHEAWATDSLLNAVFAEDTPADVSRKRWNNLKFSTRDMQLARVDDAVGMTALLVRITNEVAWAAFAESQAHAIEPEAVDRFRVELDGSMEELWEQTRLDVLYSLTGSLAHLSEAKVAHLAKQLAAPEAQAFLAWAYDGVQQVYAEATSQALRRIALYAEGASDAEATGR